MANKKQVIGQTVCKYLEKYPALPSRTIARMIEASDIGHLFQDSEQLRRTIRYYRGKSGGEALECLTDRRFLSQEPEQDNRFGIPRATEQNYEPYIVDDSLSKGFILTDVHLPYHDVTMLTSAIVAAQEFSPDFIICDEVLDCYHMSKFRHNPCKDEIKDELEAGRQFFTAMRCTFPDAHIIYHSGNHDDRFKYWLWDHPEIYNIPEIQLDQLLGLDNLGVEFVADKRIINIGKLTYCHGHELWQSIINPVNPARGLFLKAKESAACGHFHQTSEHTEPTVNGKMVTCWSIGCACQLHPEFMPINKWNHGFATVEKVPSGEFKFDNYRMVEGEIL